MIGSLRSTNLLADYDRITRSIRLKLLANYHSKLVWGLIADTRREFSRLISDIPYIGEGHIWQSSLNTSAIYLALYRVILKQGFLMSEAAQMTNDIFQAYLQSLPKFLRMAYRWYYFSSFYKSRLQECARRSQERRYPGDWLFTYLEGNGSDFNIGVDIEECAILKFYKAHQAESYLPNLCGLYETTGRLLGLGFKRTGTIAAGARICDCRWKRF